MAVGKRYQLLISLCRGALDLTLTNRLARRIARERSSQYLKSSAAIGGGRARTHHVTSRLAPTEPGQLDNCIDFCIMLSVLKFLKRTLGKVSYK